MTAGDAASIGKTPEAKIGPTAADGLELDGSERAIVVSRVALAVGGLMVGYFGQYNIERPILSYTVLGAYVAFSLLLLITNYRRRSNGTWTLASHFVELSLICVIISATEGPLSPFFVYFTFIVLLAALRWQWLGALLTGGMLSLVLMGMTWMEFLLNPDSNEIKELFMRNIYLVIVTILFAFLGDQYRKGNQKLERLRVANALHDGILQTLTAVRLKLHLAADEPDRASLIDVIGLLTDEQRRLRQFVSATRGQAEAVKAPLWLELHHLQTDVLHLARLWDCEISLTLRPHDASAPRHVASEMRQIIAEAVANAKLHGAADEISIDITQEPKAVSMQIKDNGVGIFAVTGSYNHKQIAENGIGPRSIIDRLEKLDGTIQIETARTGTTLFVSLPRDRFDKGALT